MNPEMANSQAVIAVIAFVAWIGFFTIEYVRARKGK